jgi:hypothetical protein
MANLCVFLPVLRTNSRNDFAYLPVCSIFILEEAHAFLLSSYLTPTPLSSQLVKAMYLLQIDKKNYRGTSL